MSAAILSPIVPAPPHARRAFTLAETAQQVGVSRKTITREADAGNLKTVKLRGRRLVLADDLTAYLASLSGGNL